MGLRFFRCFISFFFFFFFFLNHGTRNHNYLYILHIFHHCSRHGFGGSRGMDRVVKFWGILNLEMFHGNFGNLWKFSGIFGKFWNFQNALE